MAISRGSGRALLILVATIALLLTASWSQHADLPTSLLSARSIIFDAKPLGFPFVPAARLDTSGSTKDLAHGHIGHKQAIVVESPGQGQGLPSSDNAGCPDPFRGPEPHRSAAIDRSLCRHVQTNSSLFNLHICPIAEATCNSFAVLISRVEAEYCSRISHATASKTISSSPAEADFLRRALGPDAFELTVDGTQRLVITWPTAFDEDSCEWRYDIRLVNGGKWTLKVSHHYENYHGFRELWEDEIGAFRGKEWPDPKVRVPAWPRYSVLDQKLTSEAVLSDDFGVPMTCPTSCPAYAFDVDRTLRPESPQELPLCSRSEALSNAFLPDPFAQPGQSPGPPIPYRGLPIGCRFDSEQTALLDDTLDVSSRAACLGVRRRILFQGDSHVRTLYDALVPSLEGHHDEPVYEKSKFKTKKVFNTTLDYVWDTMLHGATKNRCIDRRCQPADAADILILSTGAHMAFNHFTSRKFAKDVAALSKTMSKRKAARRGPTLFISSPAIPPKSLQYVWDTRDWRTNYRLEKWSEESLKIMRKLGAIVSDGFSSTLSLSRFSPDRAHYRDTPAIEFWMQETLHKLALCSTHT